MHLCTLTRISIFVGLALSQPGQSSNDLKGGMSSITQLAPRQNNFTWANTSTIPPEATVEIQFDGLAGSGVINLTSHAGFTVINLTSTGMPGGSQSCSNANMTSAGTQTTNGYFPTATLPASTTTPQPNNWFTVLPTTADSFVASNTSTNPVSFTLPPTTANSSTGWNASTNPVLPTIPPTSANISIFTGAGALSKTPVPNLLFWLFLGSLPTAMLLVR